MDIPLRKFDRLSMKEGMQSNIQWRLKGRVHDVVGQLVEAQIPGMKLGSLVEIHGIKAEVVGFRGDRALLLPYSSLTGVSPGQIVSQLSLCDRVEVGEYLLGHVVDPFMNKLSALPMEKVGLQMIELDRVAPNPIERVTIKKPMPLGVRAIDGCLSFGDGQRVGIMAGSGVGKSVLLGMIARGSAADVNVIGLIGERGREVREFIENDLGEAGLAKSVVVVVTNDQSPLMKVRAAKVVHAIAEFFSQQGKSVLLMMDSLTRVAMAQREIGLAVGEPPTTKGYTPSVFSLLPSLLERSGPQLRGQGAISGIYTVLVDGDDFNDPIVDAARSILDGQINLSRRLASKGHYPAIDISTSVSRVMKSIVNSEHIQLAQKLKSLIGVYEENFDLVQIGAYQSGLNPLLDQSIKLMPRIETFLQQDYSHLVSFEETVLELRKLVLQHGS
jgi:flagellum-specific ATP synthase